MKIRCISPEARFGMAREEAAEYIGVSPNLFDQLVDDTDANLTNVLIGPDWQIWRIDFTRAFRTSKDLRNPADLVRCERHLCEKLKQLNGSEVAEKTKNYLTKEEVHALMARRDKIVEHFDALIKEKGEEQVLY